jgi:predicted metal-dependent RNase
MQEEVNERVVLVIKGGVTLSARALAKAMRKVLELRKHKNLSSHQKTGKQNIKQLIGQNAGVSNIELTNSNIKSFDRTARKYGIDYAVKKDRLSTPPKYLVFFKSRDADAMTAAFTEFSKRTLRKEKQKQSVKKTLEAFKKLIKEKGLDKVKELVKGERER